MNILSGNYPFGSYEGELILSGNLCHFTSPKDSEKLGIAIIHQELSLVQGMTIADNLFLGNEKGSRFVLNKKQTLEESKKWLNLVGLTESPSTPVEKLSAGKQQLVEIAKALSKEPTILIMDEPTSSLGDEQSAALLELMKDLRAKGKSMIIISHKLNEIIEVSDRISVLCDGRITDTMDNPTHDIDESRIICAMVGREINDLFPKRDNTITDDVALKIEHLEIESVRRPGKLSLDNINMTIHKGEIVGLYGLLGSGRTKLVRSVFGRSNGFVMRGDIELDGQKVDLKTTKDAIKAGIAYVAEDRMISGLALDRSIRENTTFAGLYKITEHGILDKAKEKAVSDEALKRFHTKAASSEQNVGELSGGNQQKVLLAEWLYTDPKLLILDEPTRGIDVGAKYEIYTIINEYVAAGGAVLLITSELPEMLGLSDRIYVLNEGKIAGEVMAGDASQESIMSMIVGEGMNE